MVERVTLQQFQDELARKLAESAHRPLAATWLGVSWQGVRALLPLTQAGEISNPTALQRMPHTKDWVLGVASVRGVLTVLVDWVRLLGLIPPATPTQGGELAYWVSLNEAMGVGAALCVDQLLGLHGSEQWQVATTNAPLHPGIRQVWRDAQGDPWYELDLKTIVESAEFQDPSSSVFVASDKA